MSGHQYVPNPANLFTDEDEIDDELFLRNAPRGGGRADPYLPADDKYGVTKVGSTYTRPDVLGPAAGFDVSGGLAYAGGASVGGSLVSVGPGGYVMDAPVYGPGGYAVGGAIPGKTLVYGGSAANVVYDSPGDDDEIAHQRQTFEQRRRELEESTLITSQRCLGVLRETEQVGIATAEELHRQREQLEKTKKQLDEINNSLRFSQKHLNSLKSVFGGLKNYLSGRMVAGGGGGGSGGGSIAGGSIAGGAGIPRQNISSPTPTEEEDLYPNPQDFRIADPYWRADQSPIPPPSIHHPHAQQHHHHHHQQHQQQQQQQQHMANGGSGGGAGFSHQLDQNLDEMRGNLSRLKNLALDLNQEIDSQNDLIDDISDRVEDVDVKIVKQNKDMNRLLRK
ncbi:synaptosomal-associated protein 29 [Anopheles bellator]|uniref:synaptosomal-associated protein 29 n=1 Tax=Anopheles bellator TaxID=139047 RepID=UPI0026492DBA|nr:synaptosomal-associated protein 29 [Anopheles bellator]